MVCELSDENEIVSEKKIWIAEKTFGSEINNRYKKKESDIGRTERARNLHRQIVDI